jgi:hypothetical protein
MSDSQHTRLTASEALAMVTCILTIASALLLLATISIH